MRFLSGRVAYIEFDVRDSDSDPAGCLHLHAEVEIVLHLVGI